MLRRKDLYRNHYEKRNKYKQQWGIGNLAYDNVDLSIRTFFSNENMTKQTSEIEDWKQVFDKAWERMFGEIFTEESLMMTGSDWKQAIELLLQDEKKKWINDLRKWTKGKEVTKDKLREYLNKEEGV